MPKRKLLVDDSTKLESPTSKKIKLNEDTKQVVVNENDIPLYFTYKKKNYSCKEEDCNWNGSGKELKLELYCGSACALYELWCPKCSEMITCCSIPTSEQIIMFSSPMYSQYCTVEPKELDEATKHKKSNENKEKTLLTSVNQLPDIPKEHQKITLLWKSDGDSGKLSYVMHANTIIWSERQYYENKFRFDAIHKILKQKYGTRLVEFKVAKDWASQLYYIGD